MRFKFNITRPAAIFNDLRLIESMEVDDALESFTCDGSRLSPLWGWAELAQEETDEQLPN